MEKFANAVKALIVFNDKVLILNNALNDPCRPGESDYPGGRLDPGEDPYLGLKREIAEELGNDAANALHIGRPLDVQNVERADGQKVTMMFFSCWFDKNVDIQLSQEHSAYKWIEITKAKQELHGKQIDVMLRALERIQ